MNSLENKKEKPKKRKGTQKYLADFRPDIDGNYVYCGNHYLYNEKGRGYKLGLMSLVALFCGGADITVGLFPYGAMGDCPYIILTWLANLGAVAAVIWSLFRQWQGKGRLREYLHKTAVVTLPFRMMLVVASSFLGFVSQLIFTLIQGGEGRMLYALAYMALMLISSGLSVLCFIYALRGRKKWTMEEKKRPAQE